MSAEPAPFEPLARGDAVMARVAPGEVVPGTIVDPGPRPTVAIYDETTYIEVDEANVWRNGPGYAVRPMAPEEEL